MKKHKFKWGKLKMTNPTHDPRITFSGWIQPLNHNKIIGHLYALDELRDGNDGIKELSVVVDFNKRPPVPDLYRILHKRYIKVFSEMQDQCDYYEEHGKWNEEHGN